MSDDEESLTTDAQHPEMVLLSCEASWCGVLIFDATKSTACPGCGEPGQEMPRRTPG